MPIGLLIGCGNNLMITLLIKVHMCKEVVQLHILSYVLYCAA